MMEEEMQQEASLAGAAEQPLGLEISREFDAPPARVFEVWTTPEHLSRWWGPKAFTAAIQKHDFREGGAYRHRITGPDGKSYGMSGFFHRIVPGERLVFTFAWDDEPGQPANETLVTVAFAPRGKGTRLTFRQLPFASAEQRDSHASGWGECLDRLVAYVKA
jgi:uncharacterized protein YndB with AHSA1/START domain